MKKALVIFILLLLAVPAMATISVTATCSGTSSPYTITVSYATTGETLPPRAFGILVSASAGTIGTVTPTTTHYYVAPGTFDYNSVSGAVAWGNPIVNKTNTSFIYEAGSLYASNDAQHPSAPPTSGTLLSFQFTGNPGDVISIAADSARGGVVREDPSVTTPAPSLTGCTIPSSICFPSTSNYAKQMSDFKAYKSYQPSWDGACWCGTVVSTKWKYQCDGDADGATEVTLQKYRIYNNDYGAVVANWKKKITDPTLNPCADYDHASEVTLQKYRVYNNDYNRVVANWKKKDSQLPGNCPRPDGQN